jgi:hypothetical protein
MLTMASWICAICGTQVAAGAETCTCGARPAPPLTRVDRHIQSLRWEIEALQADLARLNSDLVELESTSGELKTALDGIPTATRRNTR